VSATLTGLTGFESNPQFVMGTLGELRPASTSSNGTNLPDHLHRGVDLKSCPPDSDCTSREVFAVKGGLIGPINSLGVNNKTVNVGQFTYAHLESIDHAITGQQGQFVQAGTHVGRYSASFNHLHLEENDLPVPLTSGAASPTKKCNPLFQFKNYNDTIPP